ncbi:hypothetical protein HDV00_004529 [Rhizophlyctis rosea]|nr:hypothetical protein HDV00_004529 [Rhizophlyctis rosea]
MLFISAALRGQCRTFCSTRVASQQNPHLWLVIARDASDSEALKRRLKVRPEHLKRAEEVTKEGKVVLGGALLDERKLDRMVGSCMIFDLPTKAAVEEFLKSDVYSQNNVWEEWDIYPFKPANLKK